MDFDKIITFPFVPHGLRKRLMERESHFQTDFFLPNLYTRGTRFSSDIHTYNQNVWNKFDPIFNLF